MDEYKVADEKRRAERQYYESQRVGMAGIKATPIETAGREMNVRERLIAKREDLYRRLDRVNRAIEMSDTRSREVEEIFSLLLND